MKTSFTLLFLAPDVRHTHKHTHTQIIIYTFIYTYTYVYIYICIHMYICVSLKRELIKTCFTLLFLAPNVRQRLIQVSTNVVGLRTRVHSREMLRNKIQ